MNELEERAALPFQSSAEPKALVEAGTSLEVSIAGVPLRLKSTHDRKTVDQLVQFVDRKVSECLPLTKSGSVQNAAILAALNMAEELFMIRTEADRFANRLEDRTRRALDALNSHSLAMD